MGSYVPRVQSFGTTRINDQARADTAIVVRTVLYYPPSSHDDHFRMCCTVQYLGIDCSTKHGRKTKNLTDIDSEVSASPHTGNVSLAIGSSIIMSKFDS